MGIEPVRYFLADVERELFTNELIHATPAYLFYLRGCTFIHESLYDESHRVILLEVLDKSKKALYGRYPVHASECD